MTGRTIPRYQILEKMRESGRVPSLMLLEPRRGRNSYRERPQSSSIRNRDHMPVSVGPIRGELPGMPKPDPFGWLLAAGQLLPFEHGPAESLARVLAWPAILGCGKRYCVRQMACAVVGIPCVNSAGGCGAPGYSSYLSTKAVWPSDSRGQPPAAGDRAEVISGRKLINRLARAIAVRESSFVTEAEANMLEQRLRLLSSESWSDRHCQVYSADWNRRRHSINWVSQLPSITTRIYTSVRRIEKVMRGQLMPQLVGNLCAGDALLPS